MSFLLGIGSKIIGPVVAFVEKVGGYDPCRAVNPNGGLTQCKQNDGSGVGLGCWSKKAKHGQDELYECGNGHTW